MYASLLPSTRAPCLRSRQARLGVPMSAQVQGMHAQQSSAVGASGRMRVHRTSCCGLCRHKGGPRAAASAFRGAMEHYKTNVARWASWP